MHATRPHSPHRSGAALAPCAGRVITPKRGGGGGSTSPCCTPRRAWRGAPPRRHRRRQVDAAGVPGATSALGWNRIIGIHCSDGGGRRMLTRHPSLACARLCAYPPNSPASIRRVDSEQAQPRQPLRCGTRLVWIDTAPIASRTATPDAPAARAAFVSCQEPRRAACGCGRLSGAAAPGSQGAERGRWSGGPSSPPAVRRTAAAARLRTLGAWRRRDGRRLRSGGARAGPTPACLPRPRTRTSRRGILTAARVVYNVRCHRPRSPNASR